MMMMMMYKLVRNSAAIYLAQETGEPTSRKEHA